MWGEPKSGEGGWRRPLSHVTLVLVDVAAVLGVALLPLPFSPPSPSPPHSAFNQFIHASILSTAFHSDD